MFPLEGSEWSVRMDSTNGLIRTNYSVFVTGGAKEIVIQIELYESQSYL